MKKRIVMMLTFALMMCMSVMADNDRVITFDQLEYNKKFQVVEIDD